MIRLLAGFSISMVFLILGGCVVYDPYPGYYDYPRYHYHHYYQGPPVFFRFNYHRGWHGLNQEYNIMDPVFFVGYRDAPFMCVNPEYVEPDGG